MREPVPVARVDEIAMPKPDRNVSPTSELIVRVMRIVRTCPDATEDVLELILLVSQIEALTQVDQGYRHARRVIARLRHPLWDMAPEQREALRRAGEAIKAACRLDERDIPKNPLDDLAEIDRTQVGRSLAAALGDEFTPAQLARVTGAVMAIVQT